MSWWGLIRGTICSSLEYWLGWKLVFLDGTGRWTMLWYQSFPQLSHWTSAAKPFWKIFKLPLWLHTQARTSMPPLKTNCPQTQQPFLFKPFFNSVQSRQFFSTDKKKIFVFIYELWFLYWLIDRTEIWQPRFTIEALKEHP